MLFREGLVRLALMDKQLLVLKMQLVIVRIVLRAKVHPEEETVSFVLMGKVLAQELIVLSAHLERPAHQELLVALVRRVNIPT